MKPSWVLSRSVTISLLCAAPTWSGSQAYWPLKMLYEGMTAAAPAATAARNGYTWAMKLLPG